MNIYVKTILSMSIVTGLSMAIANTGDNTIYVNTFADEDGENFNACSLREAIMASYTNKAYGGCPAGNTNSSITDIIQLESGEYQLNKTLYINSQVNILGKMANLWDNKDKITGTYPERLALNTIIKGQGNFGLIDTTQQNKTVTLKEVVFEGGSDRLGGTIKAGGGLYLDRVEIKSSQASISGGAIYLSGINSSLSIKKSLIESSNAPKAAVIGMSCLDNLIFTKRDILIEDSTLINNGSINTSSVIEFCGQASVDMNSNTIAYNTAIGSIIKFTADSDPLVNQPSILSSSAKLSMVGNTVVNNKAATSFLYDSIGSKVLKYNILAYNDGYSCRHLLRGVAVGDNANLNLSFNGVIRSPNQNGYCDMPYAMVGQTNTIDLSGYSQQSIMSSLQPASGLTAYLPMYFPLDTEKNPLLNVDNDGVANCTAVDQRGRTRVTAATLILDESVDSKCDLGTTELVRLFASDLSASNLSQVVVLKGYESERDFFERLLKSATTPKEFLKYYEIRYDEFVKKIDEYETDSKYRQITFDIFAQSIPHEIQETNGERKIQHFESDLYHVVIKPIGTGPDVFASKKKEDLPIDKDPQLACEWDANKKQVIMYRKDGSLSQLGDFSYCEYTINLISEPKIKSIGLLQGVFTNIAAVAENDNYTFKWGGDQRVKLDLLANDSDNGDGHAKQNNYPVAKKPFHVHEDGTFAPIKFGKIDSNYIIDAQYQAECPDESRTICYGGDIYIQPKNNFNKFGLNFTYQVFDENASLSNEATVRIVNTATTTDDTRKGSTGGGGSIGIIGLFMLAGIAGFRRYKK